MVEILDARDKDQIIKESFAANPRCLGDIPDGLGLVRGGRTPSERATAKGSGGGVDTAFHQEYGKDRVELLPKDALRTAASAFAYGLQKYGPWNWAEHARDWEWMQLVGSTLRHIFAWESRDNIDEEAGLHHLDMAIADLLMLRSLILRGVGTDNRGPHA